MKNLYLIIVVFLVTTNTNAQKDVAEISNKIWESIRDRASNDNYDMKSDSVYVKQYERLKILYEKQQLSESYKKLEEATFAFGKKMEIRNNRASLLKSRLSLIEWIRENFEKTSFTTIEEAEEDYLALEKLRSEELIENEEYHSFLYSTLVHLKEEGGEIYKDVITDYQVNNPNSTYNKMGY